MLMQSAKPLAELENASEFIARHIGISPSDEAMMLKTVGSSSRRDLIEGIAAGIILSLVLNWLVRRSQP